MFALKNRYRPSFEALETRDLLSGGLIANLTPAPLLQPPPLIARQAVTLPAACPTTNAPGHSLADPITKFMTYDVVVVAGRLETRTVATFTLTFPQASSLSTPPTPTKLFGASTWSMGASRSSARRE